MVWTFMKRKDRFDAVAIEGSASFSDSEIPVDDHAASNLKASAIAASQCKNNDKRVVFSHVEFRLYKRVIGDNPYTEVPLALGWEYEAARRQPVEEHQERQLSRPEYKDAQMILPLERGEREALLLGAGYTKERIRLEERRRRIQLLLEWAYRQNREESTVYGCCRGPILFKRYIM
jgi:hypothetical protein